MREIKFRAWDKFQKMFVFEGFHVIGEVTALGGMESVIHETWKERKEKMKYTGTLDAWNDFELTQFTGLLDAKGRDIYEGDIVKYSQKKNGRVYYDRDKAQFCIFWNFGDVYGIDKHWAENELEIIGNIYENPELLKREG